MWLQERPTVRVRQVPVLWGGKQQKIALPTRTFFFPSVLVSAGTELTLFLVAGTVLCFGFSVRIMLITH